ncbi:MAG: hypothetical protein ABIS86_06245 [Streptosporangiaceae bacterium]
MEKIEEYRLEPNGSYRLVQLHTRRLELKTLLQVDVHFDELAAP